MLLLLRTPTACAMAEHKQSLQVNCCAPFLCCFCSPHTEDVTTTRWRPDALCFAAACRTVRVPSTAGCTMSSLGSPRQVEESSTQQGTGVLWSCVHWWQHSDVASQRRRTACTQHHLLSSSCWGGVAVSKQLLVACTSSCWLPLCMGASNCHSSTTAPTIKPKW